MVGSTFPFVGPTFPLVGSTKLKNNVSKMLIVKNQIVDNHRTLRHATTKNDAISEKLHFHFLGE